MLLTALASNMKGLCLASHSLFCCWMDLRVETAIQSQHCIEEPQTSGQRKPGKGSPGKMEATHFSPPMWPKFASWYCSFPFWEVLPYPAEKSKHLLWVTGWQRHALSSVPCRGPCWRLGWWGDNEWQPRTGSAPVAGQNKMKSVSIIASPPVDTSQQVRQRTAMAGSHLAVMARLQPRLF